MKALAISLFLFIVASLGVLVHNNAEAKRQQAVSQLIEEEQQSNLQHASTANSNIQRDPSMVNRGKL